jgi:D-inositol-3-phosphate glycosyltransferase
VIREPSRAVAALRAGAHRLIAPEARAAVRGAAHRVLPRLIAPPYVPPPPVTLFGALDGPSEGAAVAGASVLITGWALNRAHAPSRVEIFLNGASLGRARLGIERPDVVAAGFGGDAPFAGYELLSVLPASAEGTVVVTGVAHFAGGLESLEMGPRTFVVDRRETPSGASLTTKPHAPHPRPSDAASLPTVLVVTHQLDLGGGQLYLHELLLQLQKLGLFRFVVVSPIDGELRPQLEGLDIQVHLTSPWPLDNGTTYHDRIDEVVAWARDLHVDALLANTIVAFPGIHLASRLDVPSVWAIHESYPEPLLWESHFGHGSLDPVVQASASAALDEADLLVFEAEATRALLSTPERASRCALVRYGVDFAAIDAAAPSDRATARLKLGISPSARVLLCMGRYERRKAQVSIIQAFQTIAHRHPTAQLVLVGDDGTPYAQLVRRLAEEAALGDQLRLENVTPEILAWYRAADILLSASDTESMPRSAFEAMALGSPVLATSVYGVPELIEDGVTGWLFPERDVEALATGIERALSTSSEELARMAARASEHVRANHDSSGYVAAYSKILDGLISRRDGRRR